MLYLTVVVINQFKVTCSVQNFNNWSLRWGFQIRISNGTGQCNLSRQRDRRSFVIPGQKDNSTSSKSCHGTGQDGPGQPVQIRAGTGFWQPVAYNFWIFFFSFFLIFDFFVPGHPGIKEFVPGFLLLLLSRDRGIAGQGFFCLGIKVQRDVPFLENPNSNRSIQLFSPYQKWISTYMNYFKVPFLYHYNPPLNANWLDFRSKKFAWFTK